MSQNITALTNLNTPPPNENNILPPPYTSDISKRKRDIYKSPTSEKPTNNPKPRKMQKNNKGEKNVQINVANNDIINHTATHQNDDVILAPDSETSQTHSSEEQDIEPPPNQQQIATQKGTDNQALSSSQTDHSLIPEDLRKKILIPLDYEFPTQEGITESNILSHIDNETKKLWKKLPGNRIYCFLAFDRIRPNSKIATNTLEEIYSFLQELIGEGDHVVNPPVLTNNPTTFPGTIPFLISNLPSKYANLLTIFKCWVMEDNVFFFFPEHFEPSTYTMTLKNIPVPDKGPSDEMLAKQLIQNINDPERATYKTLTQILEANHYSDTKTHATVQKTLQTIKVARMKFSLGNKEEETCLRIYMEPPTLDASKHEKWIETLRGHTFIIPAGKSAPHMDIVCNLCKGRDHLTNKCKFKEIPGWPTNLPKENQTKTNTQTDEKNRGRKKKFGNPRRLRN